MSLLVLVYIHLGRYIQLLVWVQNLTLTHLLIIIISTTMFNILTFPVEYHGNLIRHSKDPI